MKKKKVILIFIALVITIFLVGYEYNAIEQKSVGEKTGQNTTIANPASVYCAEHGGRLEMKTKNQGEYGICVFQNGKSCEEWAFFRGECKN